MILLAVLAVIVLLLLIAVLRTLLMPSKTSTYVADEPEEEALALAEKLSKMIQYDTTSYANVAEVEKFLGFHKVLEELFPLVHEKLEKTEIDGNLLFYWKGKSSEKPILLMSHQDVVPAEGEWVHAPFSGDIAEGKVWGRGASDTKASVMAFFQAVEELLSEGFVPPTDVYLASSCTEEWGGDGAPKIVAELQRRGIELFLVCDEGGAIITEPIGGIHGNFAMVGVFEKGKADVKFTARSNGGHASAPSKGTPIARLSAFVNEVETHSPFRKKLLPEKKGKHKNRIFETQKQTENETHGEKQKKAGFLQKEMDTLSNETKEQEPNQKKGEEQGAAALIVVLCSLCILMMCKYRIQKKI